MDPALPFIAAGLVAGAIFGSFIATLLIRWPQGKSVAAGRSTCDGCGRPLGPGDLVPLLSYAALHGRCRGCGAAIDRRHDAVELAAAAIGVIAFAVHPFPLALLSAALGLWLLLLAWLDAAHFWLPDRLTIPLALLGLAVGWAGFGPSLELRLIGMALGWAVLGLIGFAYRRLRGRDGLGGGDPKMLAAIGAWLGAWHLPLVLVGTGLAGIGAVIILKLRGRGVGATTRLPLGSLMAVAAWPIWLVVAR